MRQAAAPVLAFLFLAPVLLGGLGCVKRPGNPLGPSAPSTATPPAGALGATATPTKAALAMTATPTKTPASAGAPTLTPTPSPAPAAATATASPTNVPQQRVTGTVTNVPRFTDTPSETSVPQQAYTATWTPTTVPQPITNTATPTQVPPQVPTATATPTINLYPPMTPSPTEVPATLQTIWDNGTAGPWWGEPVTAATDNASTGSVSDASLTNGLNGDTTVLAYTAVGGASTGLATFSIPAPIDAGGYAASGHLVFDIQLGPAWSAANAIVAEIGGYAPAGVIFDTSALGGLSTGAFTQVSISFAPHNPGWPGGAFLAPTQIIEIGVLNSAAVPTGVLFYLDDVQMTPN